MATTYSGVRIVHGDEYRSADELKDAILTKFDEPLVFKGMIDSWTFARMWSPIEICQMLRYKQTTFKTCPKYGTDTFRKRFKENDVVFETQCEHVEGEFSDFQEWLEDKVLKRSPRGNTTEESSYSNYVQLTGQPAKSEQAAKKPRLASEKQENKAEAPLEIEAKPPPKYPFFGCPRSEYWAYADYKYMCELCSDMPELQSAIDWSVFGFHGRDGKDSTLWVGSEGACTPCHYDTYGCNLVAQLWGRKRWLLFPPDQSEWLYPTRVPYEESSVFSSVNVCHPDLVKFPKFARARAFETILSPGDVLFVPRHWWHYVECLEPAVSVNTWIDLPSDTHERVKEAVVRTLVSAFGVEEQETERQWLNPNEARTAAAAASRVKSSSYNYYTGDEHLVLFPGSPPCTRGKPPGSPPRARGKPGNETPCKENVRLLSLALRERAGQLPSSGRSPPASIDISKEDFIRVVTSDRVVRCIVDGMSGAGETAVEYTGN